MSQPFPAGRFRWVVNLEKLKDSIIEMAKKVGKGYLLEVDVFYPQNLHNLHNNLPFMCKKRKINEVKSYFPCNLCNNKKCVVHIAALDQALKHGLVLDKVHRVTEFDQSAWLALYIKFEGMN